MGKSLIVAMLGILAVFVILLRISVDPSPPVKGLSGSEIPRASPLPAVGEGTPVPSPQPQQRPVQKDQCCDDFPSGLPMDPSSSFILGGKLEATRVQWESLQLSSKADRYRGFIAFPLHRVNQGCVGRVLLCWDGSPSAEGAVVSRDTHLSSWMSSVAGPDAFRLSVSGGKEKVAGSSRFLANTTLCSLAAGSTHRFGYSYIIEFAVREAGKYEIELKWELDNNWALNEVKDTVTHFKNAYLARGTQIPGSCKGPPQQGQHISTILRRCNDTGGSGRWVRSTVEPKRGQLPAYYPWKGHEWEYRLDGCRLDSFYASPNMLLEQLQSFKARIGGRPVKLFFTGDSQVRTVFRHWVSIVSNSPADIAKGGNLSYTDGTHSVQYIWDPYLEAILNRSTMLAEGHYDVIVLGIGPWPSSFGQWPMKQFASRLAAVAEHLKRFVELRLQAQDGIEPLVVWAGAPAWPKPRKMPGFRITNSRLGTMNTIAVRRLRKGIGQLHFRHLDWFQPSLSMTHLHRGDGMHYDHSIVLYTAASMLANIVLEAPGTASSS